MRSQGMAPMGFGSGGPPPPRDVVVLLAVVFVTFSLQFFQSTGGLLQLLMLTPAVWRFGAAWQLATYAFIGEPTGPFWFLITLLILFWFGRDVYRALGRKGFWQVIAWGVLSASVSACLTAMLMDAFGALPRTAFLIIQGESILLTIFVAAFATLYGNATILLFFVLPLRARWFLWLEVVIAFLIFLSTKDLPGFVGLTVAVGVTYSLLTLGGPRRALREWRLRIEKFFIEQKMKRLQSQRERKKGGFRVIDGGRSDSEHRDGGGKKGNGGDDPFGGGWVN